MMWARAGVFLFLATATAATTGCGSSAAVPASPQSAAVRTTTLRPASASSPIKHVVIIVQENRTFNDFFATYPGGDGTTVGQAEAEPNCSPAIPKGPITLSKVPLVVPKDLDHRYSGYRTAYNHGKMNGFDKVPFGNGIPECTYPYQYTDPMQIQQYWQMAQQYVLAEHMFTTQGSDSFTAHQDLIRGGTIVETGKAMVDLPNCSNCFWGCDAKPAGVRTSLITRDNVYLQKQGPFPCSNKFSVAYPSLRDLLDAKKVTWKYYQPGFQTNFGKLLSAFDVIWPVRNGPEWKNNIITPQTAIFGDITSGNLPGVSWVIPDQQDSDHPGVSTDTGPQWVASVVNAIGQSSYWDSSAIIVVWDDWGGLYDNAPPDTNVQKHGYGGLGFRVPALVISPYAKAGTISKTNYEFGSILKYIEGNWNLGSLGTTDVHAASIIDCFDYSQSPITFVPIGSKLSKEYFIRRKPSNRAPDTDM